jgi:hypothetical protein
MHLDEFGLEEVQRLAHLRDGSADALVRTAALYYLAERGVGRPVWRVPSFVRETPATPARNVTLDDETWRALNDEALRQGVAPGLLAEHALLYFISDLDDGKLALRLGDALDGSGDPL